MRLFEPFIAQHVFDGEHKQIFNNCILFDSFLPTRDQSYFKKFAGKNAFLVNLSDESYEGGYSAYRHFRGVFRTYWSSAFHPAYVMTLPLGYPDSDVPAKRNQPASLRPYLWSFLGEANKASRPDMLRALKSVEPQFTFVTDANTALSPTGRMTRAQCDDVLSDSVFVPCPMGNVALESWRAYEALQSGAIPIVERRLTLDYYKGLLGNHPLPTVRSWDEAAKLIERLRHDPVALDAMQQQCMEWWTGYPPLLTQRIGQFLEHRSSSSDAVIPLRSLTAKLPFWNYVELVRHHNSGALRRRVMRQVARLLQDKTWRITPKR